jgi:hypothetical protein
MIEEGCKISPVLEFWIKKELSQEELNNIRNMDNIDSCNFPLNQKDRIRVILKDEQRTHVTYNEIISEYSDKIRLTI